MEHLFGERSQDDLVNAFIYMNDRWPEQPEFDWLKRWSNCSYSPASVNFGISPGFDHRRPTVVFYSACHSIQLVHFFINWSKRRPLDGKNWLALFPVQMDREYEATGKMPEFFRMFETALRKADTVIYTPMFRTSPVDRNPTVLRQRLGVNGDRWFSFHAPSFAALWPVCQVWGDEHIVRRLRRGESPQSIKAGLRNGTLDCDLPARWCEDFQRLIHKDAEVQAKFAFFFASHWRNSRLFLSYNHPSYRLASYLGIQIERMMIGEPPVVWPEEQRFCLQDVPLNPCEFGFSPDHPIAFRELGFSYPVRFPDTAHQYEQFVDDCYQRIKDTL